MTDPGHTNGTRLANRVGLKHYALAVALMFSPQMLWAQGAGQFEQPPIIDATQLLPESALFRSRVSRRAEGADQRRDGPIHHRGRCVSIS